jgi:FKBP-type peptidyl-prolyl cis-trans isomerase
MRILLLLPISLLLFRCGAPIADTSTSTSKLLAAQPRPEFTIRDSAKITTYEQGLRIYLVRSGPGTRPIDGTALKLHYQGRLPDGTVFDDTWARNEPLEFIMGKTGLIPGMEAALRKIRMGSRAVIMIPPALGYTTDDLPPKIPKNSPLIYELEMLGYI